MMGKRALLLAAVLAGAAAPAFGGDGDDDDASLAAARTAALKTFKEQIAPFITTYCLRCHGEKKQKAGVRFDYAIKTPAVPSFRKLWTKAVTHLQAGDMPPEGEKQPGDAERKAIADWVANLRVLSPKDPGEFVIRRLSKVELGNSLRDLFRVDPAIVGDLPDEVLGAGYLNSVSPLLMERCLMIAGDVLHKMPADRQKELFDVDPAKAKEFATSIARRAYRRPPTEAEVEVLMRVYTLAIEKGRPHSEALRFVLKAVLVSPQFLFITPESEPPPGADIVPLGDHQLASRLSYLLWATMPDAELSALADAGKLREPTVLAAQARRLLADPRSRALFDGFGAQWLGLDKLAGKTFDASKFPQMTPVLRASMLAEGRLFFESILRENRSVATFVDADYVFVNETLASIYGLKGVSGPELRRVALSDGDRGGILSMPGILATTSFPTRTSPVNRGVWVLEQILGQRVPPPPANVPPLEKQDHEKVAGLTLRQRTELHRRDPTCASCHKVLDPIGFGLENFDAIGRWRERDESGGVIDATGELPGDLRFSSPKELKRIVAGRLDDFTRNLTGRLLAYALCRQLEGYDEIVVERMARSVARDGYKMQTLVVAVVTSYPFTHRRIHELKGPSNAK
jgi:mono/diheme cytochrome c family protein